MSKYKILKGINWTPPGGKAEKRAEPGTFVEDKLFSKSSVAAFLAKGAIEHVKDTADKGQPTSGKSPNQRVKEKPTTDKGGD